MTSTYAKLEHLRGRAAVEALARFHWDPIACGRWFTRRYGEAAAIAPPWKNASDDPSLFFFSGHRHARGIFDSWGDLRPTGLWPVKAPRHRTHERLRFNFLCLSGAKHAHYSRQIAEPFRRDLVEDQLARQRGLVATELDQIETGVPLDLSEICRRIATICVFDAMFGERDPERAMEVGDLLQRYHELNWKRSAIFMPIRAPGTAYSRVLSTAEEVKRELGVWLEESLWTDEAAMRAELDAEREPNADAGGVRGAIARMLDEEGAPAPRIFKIANLATVAWAAFDTPWLALLWTLTHLARRPDAIARLRAELDGLDEAENAGVRTLGRAQYLNGCLYESLRLSPPAPFIGLRSVRDTQCGDIPVPSGSTLFLSVYETHRDPNLYPDPEMFRPERWDQKAPDAYSFIAFSGGVRRCPGYSYSMMFLRMALTEILSRLDIELVSQDPIRTRAAPTLAPAEEVQCWILPRTRTWRRRANRGRALARNVA